jgi:hypothetical protein
MPIEIKELHIRVTVNTPQDGQQQTKQTRSAGSGDENDKDAIVAECVEQTLQILQHKQER